MTDRHQQFYVHLSRGDDPKQLPDWAFGVRYASYDEALAAARKVVQLDPKQPRFVWRVEFEPVTRIGAEWTVSDTPIGGAARP